MGLALLASASLSLAFAACGGGSSPSAASLLNDTFHSHRAIASGQVDLTFALSARGSPASGSGRGFSLHLAGPFQSLGAGRLPSFALTLGVDSGGRILNAGAVSIAGRLYLELGGVSFLAPATTTRALDEGYAQALAPTAAGRQSPLAGLGIEPGAWLTHASLAGSSEVAGAKTLHIVAGLDPARFLADAQRLASAAGALGSGQGAGLLTPARAAALSASVRSARVDLYTGAHDHLLRRIALNAALITPPAARATLGGLVDGSLTFALQFAQLNRPQTIAAPSAPQPLSRLGPILERLGLARRLLPSG